MAPRIVRATSGAILVFLSMICVSMFELPLTIPLLLTHATYPIYRVVVDTIVALWHAWIAFLLENVYGIRYVCTGDAMRREACIMASNHRTRLDWMMLWPMLLRDGVLQCLNIVLKSDIKRVPMIGWGTQMRRYVHLSRKWEADEEHMTRMLELIGYSPSEPYALLLFPEGTDLQVKGIAASDAFAEKKGLKKYQYVMHPRVRGFQHCVRTLRTAAGPLAAVYDVTMAYAGHIAQKEQHLLVGKLPSAVYVHVERYAIAEMPADDAGLEAWVTAKFAEKEEALRIFYTTGCNDLEGAIRQARGKPAATTATKFSAEVARARQPWVAYFRATVFQLLMMVFLASAAWRHPLIAAAMAACAIVLYTTLVPQMGGLDVLEVRLHSRRPRAPRHGHAD